MQAKDCFSKKIINIFDKTIKIIIDENKRLGTMLKRKDNNNDKLIHKYLYASITEENSLHSKREIFQ